jgi:hypothetical protein
MYKGSSGHTEERAAANWRTTAPPPLKMADEDDVRRAAAAETRSAATCRAFRRVLLLFKYAAGVRQGSGREMSRAAT